MDILTLVVSECLISDGYFTLVVSECLISDGYFYIGSIRVSGF